MATPKAPSGKGEDVMAQLSTPTTEGALSDAVTSRAKDICRISTGYSRGYFGKRLDATAQHMLGCSPVMECAEALAVRETTDPHSGIRETLPAHSRLVALKVEECEDGSKQALIAAHEAALPRKPLGWATVASANGTWLIHTFARPLYEVCLQAKVRAGSDLNSRFVCKLNAGAKVHVVDTQRLQGGPYRVRVRILGEEEPCGWLTVRTNDGPVIQDVDAPTPWKPHAAFSPVVERLALRSPASSSPRPMSTRSQSSSSSSPSSARRLPSSSVKTPSTCQGVSTKTSPVICKSSPATSSSMASLLKGAGDGSRWGSKPQNMTTIAPGLPAPPPAPPPAPSSGEPTPTAGGEAPVTTGGSSLLGKLKGGGGGLLRGKLKGLLAGAVAADKAEKAESGEPAVPAPPKVDFMAVVKAATKAMAVPGSTLTLKSSAVAIAKAADDILAMTKVVPCSIITVSTLESKVKGFEQQARDVEAGGSGPSLSTRIGEILKTKHSGAKKLDALLKEWDPNGDGDITKQEFRLNVRLATHFVSTCLTPQHLCLRSSLRSHAGSWPPQSRVRALTPLADLLCKDLLPTGPAQPLSTHPSCCVCKGPQALPEEGTRRQGGRCPLQQPR